MPVVVTAAESPLGRLVVRRLVADGAEVRAVVERETTDLGVPTALATWNDAERLGAVLEGAHTVVHLASAKRIGDLLAAAEDSGVRRLVLLGSGPDDVPYEVVVLPDTRRRWRTPPEVLEALAEAVVEADRRR
ncbi:MAG TPA: NAD(P)H-binding protein [Frankiaceae bacterium]|nr:NAD(P)H-binding protein [Frankiaceae bacterium]